MRIRNRETWAGSFKALNSQLRLQVENQKVSRAVRKQPLSPAAAGECGSNRESVRTAEL